MLRLLFSISMFMKTLCVKNPLKIIFLILGTVLLSVAYKNSDKSVAQVNKLIFYHADGTNYFKVHSADNGNTYKLSHDSVKPHSYTLYDYNTIFYLTCAFGGISMGAFIIGLFLSIFSDDSEFKWNFAECFSESMTSFVVCDIEDGKFHYTIFGRLIAVTDNKTTNSYNYGIDRLDKILALPKYKTKSRSREDKLDKLGVK